MSPKKDNSASSSAILELENDINVPDLDSLKKNLTFNETVDLKPNSIVLKKKPNTKHAFDEVLLKTPLLKKLSESEGSGLEMLLSLKKISNFVKTFHAGLAMVTQGRLADSDFRPMVNVLNNLTLDDDKKIFSLKAGVTTSDIFSYGQVCLLNFNLGNVCLNAAKQKILELKKLNVEKMTNILDLPVDTGENSLERLTMMHSIISASDTDFCINNFARLSSAYVVKVNTKTNKTDKDKSVIKSSKVDSDIENIYFSIKLGNDERYFQVKRLEGEETEDLSLMSFNNYSYIVSGSILKNFFPEEKIYNIEIMDKMGMSVNRLASSHGFSDTSSIWHYMDIPGFDNFINQRTEEALTLQVYLYTHAFKVYDNIIAKTPAEKEKIIIELRDGMAKKFGNKFNAWMIRSEFNNYSDYFNARKDRLDILANDIIERNEKSGNWSALFNSMKNQSWMQKIVSKANEWAEENNKSKISLN